MIDTYHYKDKKYLRIIQTSGFYGFAGLLVLMIICTLVGLTRMAVNSGEINAKDYYKPYDYQELLINNLGYKLKINNKELTKYKRPELEMPLIVELNMGNNEVYEVLVKKENTWIPIIVKKLYIQVADN